MKTTMKLLKSIAPFALLSILTFCTSQKSEKTDEGEQLVAELSSTWKQLDLEINANHPIIKSVKLISDSIAVFKIKTSTGESEIPGKWKFKLNKRKVLDLELKSDFDVKQLQTDTHPYNLLIKHGKQGENTILLPVVFVN